MNCWNVVSPNQDLRIEVKLTDAGQVAYSLFRGELPVIVNATFGLDVRPAGYIHRDLKLIEQSSRQVNERYRIIAGKATEAVDHCHEQTLILESPGGARLTLIFRAYDDGMAIRYIAPEGTTEIVAERTEFAFAADQICWAMDLPHFQSSFESDFKRRKLSDLRPGELISCPITLEMADGSGVAITEAGLSDFAGMYLEARPGSPTTLLSRLAPHHDGSYCCVKQTRVSPWRVIQVAASPAKLIESNILYSLNDPCAIEDVSWIRPGKVTWDWWAGHAPSGKVQRPGMNNETMKDYIDFAAEMGLEYMLIDGGWYGQSQSPDADPTRSCPGIDLPMLVKYANDKGVDIMVWVHQADLASCLEKAFAYYASLNIKGVKVDFFDRDDQDMVRWAQKVVTTAARYKLLVDLHGIFKPTGVERTWPNLMTHEGIMGAEYNKWSRRITPEHNVTIPFTRMLAGPMDYTPGAFGNVTADRFVPRHTAPMAIGTRANNLAMYVVYQSGLQMVSDYPDAIRNQRGSDWLKVVPSAWDETRVIAGEIGQFIVIARRKGRDWFLGAMTNSQERQLTIPLSFLGDGSYQCTMYCDGYNAAQDPTSIMIREIGASADGVLLADLAPAGGLAAHFRAS